MAGNRLERWSTLDSEELRDRVAAEIERTDLTFAETQLLEAAQRRLRNWREPRNGNNTRRRAMVNDTETTPDTAIETPETEKPKAKKRKASAKKQIEAVTTTANAAEETDTAAEDTAAVTDEGEPKVKKAKKAKKAAAPAAKKTAKKAKKKAVVKGKAAAAANGSNGRANMEDIVRWKKGVENPFREGSGSYKRTEIVKSNSGSTRKTIQSKAVKASTIATLARMGLVEIDKAAD